MFYCKKKKMKDNFVFDQMNSKPLEIFRRSVKPNCLILAEGGQHRMVINIYCTSLILSFKLMQTYNLEIPPERGCYGSIHKIHVIDWQSIEAPQAEVR